MVAMTRFTVVGGTGTIGSRVVHGLQDRGHEVVVAARSTGVDAISGEGLDWALAGADVVVDTTRPPGSADHAQVLAFFTAATARLLAAGAAAGVRHHVLLSSVGSDRDDHAVGYYRAKGAQVRLVAESTLPHSIVLATQFFEFVTTIADVSTRDGAVRLPGALSQPIAADDVAAAIVEVGLGDPLDGVVEIAGPERFALDDLARRVLTHDGDPRPVVRDDSAPYFGARIAEDTLLPGPGAVVHQTRLEDWLARRGS